MNKMKRIFSLVLAFSIVLGTFGAVVPAFAEEDAKVETVVETKPETTEAALKEVPKDVIGTEHETAVRRLVAFGIVGGYPDGTYKPENAVNRAHFSKIIVEALGLADAVPAATGQNTAFKDVKGNHWASGYINVASGNGLLKGFPDGTFRPANQVTYAQALTMLVRALGYQDDFLQGNWPGNYVSKAADVGITAGVKIPSNAQEGAKRGYIADLVNNALDAKVIKVETYKPSIGAIEYYETDIPLLKDKLEISKYEDTRIVEDKVVNDGLAKDELRVKFLEDVEKYSKNNRYDRGEIVKRSYDAGQYDTLRFVDTVNPREIIGEEVTTYVNDNDKVIYVERENDDKANFDYVDKLKGNDKDKLNLVKFDRDYSFETNKSDRRDDSATIHVFDVKGKRYELNKDVKDLNLKDLVGRMGKFVVKNNRIVYAEIMEPAETPDFMVVLKNNDGQLEGVNGETENFKKDLRDKKDYDFSLVFNTKGEKLALKDIKEGNVIYVQEHKYDGDDVAVVTVVQDNKIEGEMGKVKTDRIEIADKSIKVVNYDKGDGKVYPTAYAVTDIEEVKPWDPVESTDWEDDMEDAYKQEIVAYTDAVGRIAFLTTDGGNSGYKFGIVTRTYADGDRIRIYTTIDGKEGKDQIFKADKERDISVTDARMLDANGLETDNPISKEKDQTLLGSAVKFRLNNDGEIAKDKFFVMPYANVKTMSDDFGKDIIRTTDGTFAVNSDATVVIDAATAPEKAIAKDKVGNLDGQTINGLEVDVDDFSIATWKDIKEDKEDDKVKFFIFPKSNKKDREVDGLVFVGKEGANTGSDEEAIYVLDQWKKGDDLVIEYVKYPKNEKETRIVDNESRLALDKKEVKKETAYVGREKSNGKIELFGKLAKDYHVEDSPKKDFVIYRNVKIDKISGNYLVPVKGKDLLLSGSLVYEEDKSKTTSFLKKDMIVDVISDGIRARVVGFVDESDIPGTTTPEDKDVYTYEGTVSIKGQRYVVAKDSAGRKKEFLADDNFTTKAKIGDKVTLTTVDVGGKTYVTEAVVYEAPEKPEEVDTKALEAAIEKAEKHEKAEELAEAIKEAKEALEAKTQAEVDKAVKALEDAIAEVEKEEPGEEITATYKLDADILGVKSYKITLVNAEIEDIEKVEVDGEAMPFEIMEGEYFINVSSGAPTKVVVFVNGQEVVATAE